MVICDEGFIGKFDIISSASHVAASDIIRVTNPRTIFKIKNVAYFCSFLLLFKPIIIFNSYYNILRDKTNLSSIIVCFFAIRECSGFIHYTSKYNTTIDMSNLLISSLTTLETLCALPDSSVDEARVVETIPNDDFLEHIFRSLKPSSKLVIENIATRELGNSLSTDLKIQGFCEIMCAKDTTSGDRFVVAVKPSLSVGATATITLPTANKWSLNTMDLADEELVDEAALLDQSDLPVPETKSNDCNPDAAGKKRACANCSCGLAEKQASESSSSSASAPSNPSSCGGCYKGDAFRCGGCPYLGTPAFEPGQERMVLALSDDI